MAGERVREGRDHYALGWEAGVEQCRRILSGRMADPAAALAMMSDLLIEGHRQRLEAKKRAEAKER